MTRRIEYSAEEVMQVMDLGYELEVWLNPTEDVFATTFLRACRLCYEYEPPRYRRALYGDFLLGEESMCKVHRERKKAGVSPEGMMAPIVKQGRPKVNSGPCSVEGCEKPQKTKGLCNAHYVAKWRAGKT